ncbi:MAG: tetratricopeptide repeat protein, partial [Gemmatimonadaceae bacterium]
MALILAPFLGCSLSRPGVVARGPLVERADLLVAKGETAAALALLDSAVRLEPSNALAWHRRGMLAWAMARPHRSLVAPMSGKNIDLFRTADTSLRLARRLAPDSGRYALDLGRYYLNGDLITLRIRAPGQFSHALKAGRRVGDSALVAAANDELGMVHWRRYESLADRRLLTGLNFVQAQALVVDARSAHSLLTERSVPLKPPAGLGQYATAVGQFKEAVQADPEYPSAWRHLHMTLAASGQWDSLRTSAVKRLDVASHDHLAWLALGLAQHRLGNAVEATQAFDSGLAMSG